MAADHQNVAALLAALSTPPPKNPLPIILVPTANPFSSAARPPGAQGPPGGYSGLGQPQVASPPIGYNLPQPSASGSLDLSNIKPTASGKVSLDDAVARAKARAAEMGIQQGYRGEQARESPAETN